MDKTLFLKLWTAAVGAMDALTGLLLIFAPGLVLRLLGIDAPSDGSLVFLSWIGVFVAAVGLSYAFAFVRNRGWGEAVWLFTGLVRIMVCVFLVTRITMEDMDRAWIVVAVSDGVVAAVQFAVVRKGWWREVHR